MERTSTGVTPRGVVFHASWDMVETDTVHIGEGVFLPERFRARFTSPDDHVVEMEIVVEDGVPVCNEVQVLRNPARPSLTGLELRRFPLAEWVSYACSRIGFANHGGVTASRTEFGSEERRADIEGTVRKAQQRRRVTDEHLKEVALVYRANKDGHPIEALRERFGGPGRNLGHSTARRWVTLARERGFLPPTTRGKVTAD